MLQRLLKLLLSPMTLSPTHTESMKANINMFLQVIVPFTLHFGMLAGREEEMQWDVRGRLQSDPHLQS